MSDWAPYFRDRLIRDNGTHFVIRPMNVENPVPLSCDLCSTLYRSREDESSHLEFGCCNSCAMRWAHPDRKRWKDGWRPTKDQVQDNISLRSQIKVVINLD